MEFCCFRVVCVADFVMEKAFATDSCDKHIEISLCFSRHNHLIQPSNQTSEQSKFSLIELKVKSERSIKIGCEHIQQIFKLITQPMHIFDQRGRLFVPVGHKIDLDYEPNEALFDQPFTVTAAMMFIKHFLQTLQREHNTPGHEDLHYRIVGQDIEHLAFELRVGLQAFCLGGTIQFGRNLLIIFCEEFLKTITPILYKFGTWKFSAHQN